MTAAWTSWSIVLSPTRSVLLGLLFFFFNATATTEIYTLSLHDALPILFVPGEHFLAAAAERAPKLIEDAFRKDRKSTRLNSSHSSISYAVFCLKKKKGHNTVVGATVFPHNKGLRAPRDDHLVEHVQRPT